MAQPRMFQPPPPPGAGGAPPGPPGGPAAFRAPPGPPAPGAPAGPTVFQPPPPGQGPPAPSPGKPAASSQFYQAAAPAQPGPAQPGPPGAVPGMAPAAPAVNENIDFNIKIPDNLFRLTAQKLPQTAAQASSSKIPFGAILRPLAPEGQQDEPVDTVQPGQAGIIRCKRCRTYINPFVTWTEHGRRWRCNICSQVNDVPSAYFCHLDEQGLRRDRFDRPELSKGVVEFIAPAEYMVRPPQEPTYFFVIDVSAASVRNGMLHHAAAAIKASLDDLPGRGRTKIGFITFDNCVHYYNLDSGLSNPQMLVVSDLKELFVPLPENLLVNLKESRDVVDSFLNSLPEMFAKNPVDGQSCLGPALKAAFTVVKSVGGKMCVFQSIQPNLGDGTLKPREQPGIMGTPKEVTLLKADASSSWYKDTAVEFSRVQISVDLFLFPYQYMDLAALGDLAKYTSGSMHSYVMFNRQKDGQRFEQQLHKTLTQTTAFEAVMRIRCTKGMRITNFYGNFYIRGTDLMALPNCNTESVFAFDLAHDEQSVALSHVTIQAALLYTSSDGERRIRVMTQALPVTSLISEVISSVDTDACTCLLAKQAIEVTMKSGLDNARLRLQQVCVEIIRAAKGGDKRTVSGYSVPPPPGQMGGGESEEKPIPDNLKLLPLYTLALMKNVAFRGGTDVHPDERVQSYHLLNKLWVPGAKHFVYPRMFAIHEMGADAGHPSNDTNLNGSSDRIAGRNRIVLPPIVNLSVDQLTSNGVYLLDNGVDMFLWVGRSADIGLVGSLFGVQSLDDIEPDQIQVQTTGDTLATRFGSIVSALNEDESDAFVINRKINVIREGSPAEVRFYWFLVEDRASFQGGTHSYAEFMSFVNNPSASAGAGGGPRAPPGPGGPPTVAQLLQWPAVRCHLRCIAAHLKGRRRLKCREACNRRLPTCAALLLQVPQRLVGRWVRREWVGRQGLQCRILGMEDRLILVHHEVPLLLCKVTELRLRSPLALLRVRMDMEPRRLLARPNRARLHRAALFRLAHPVRRNMARPHRRQTHNNPREACLHRPQVGCLHHLHHRRVNTEDETNDDEFAIARMGRHFTPIMHAARSNARHNTPSILTIQALVGYLTPLERQYFGIAADPLAHPIADISFDEEAQCKVNLWRH
jgi:protein transport protein SEC24